MSSRTVIGIGVHYWLDRRRNDLGRDELRSPLLEISLVLLRLDHVASGIVNAKHRSV